MESPLAFVLVLVMVFTHAMYAVLIKLSGNRLVLFGAVNGLTALLGLPLWFVVPFPSVSVLPYVLCSSIAYNLMLYLSNEAYKRGDLSVAFPLRKAISFVFVVAMAKVVFNEHALWYEWIAFVMIVCGILLQTNRRELHKIHHIWPFVVMASVGLASGLQAIIDIMGVRSAQNPFSFIVALMFIGLPVTLWAYLTHKHNLRDVLAQQKGQIVASSLLDNIGYASFLYAVYVARALYAVPLSSLSVVVATLFGLYHLKESMRLRRLLSAAMIAAAIAGVHTMDIFYR